MNCVKTAYFRYHPRNISELMTPHLHEKEQRFKIVTTVSLPEVDYENFVADMLVWRAYIEESALLCSWGTIPKCILVKQYGKPCGVLVVPDNTASVGWAAVYQP